MKKKIGNKVNVSLVLIFFVAVVSCKKDEDVTLQFNQNLEYGTLTDIEGNVYKTIEIGTQTWMAENLRVTKQNDGSSSISFKWPLNDSIAFKNAYGAKYNWGSVNTGKLCPEGWHVPKDNEWTVLTNYLGGDSIAGGKLKEAGPKHWSSPNVGATNETGFTAMPSRDGSYPRMMGFMWSSSEFNSEYGWYRALDHNSAAVYRNFDFNKSSYYSVRCIKD